ncbi:MULTISPECIES: TlpA family protein disulfide reductase [Cupriavidus]|uniref:Putative thioredoxin-related transmembrane protein n=1 Tax=Cupriavidus pinatubonensis (strain JMP 134 / LMG 1197) TaxID=264198 RepID=Q46XA9_CUPPJ|nr:MULTISPECIES: TlpA disulfide reductase family protein [Cupriavidus]QYY31080.1 TlpA family protein disulfide reductase [Cupriavidus pinatubonensis]TPQ31654.1 TlpA family protein disulfide reductase [Cupriavidus pinatubonensis]
MNAPTQKPVRRSRLWLWVAVAVVACAAGALAGQFVFAPKAASDHAVETFFQTRLPDPSGADIDLSKLRGKTVVINFWAPWCGPCVEEMPELTALHAEYAPRKVEFVGIGIDSAANIQQFVKKVPVAYPLAVAGFAGTELSRNFGNAAGGLPYTVVINPDGSVKYRKMGRVTSDELRAVLPRS